MSLACGNVSAVGPKLAPSAVKELAALPPDYRAGPRLDASCAVARAGALDDEALGNVDCSLERLSRVLRARAGELSAPVLVDKACNGEGSGARLECSATVARPTLPDATAPSVSGPAPSPPQVLDIDDPRPQESQRIRVSFAPTKPASPQPWPARAYDRVAETAWPSVGRSVLGSVSARCDSCSASALRYALRVTAGRAGAGEVSSVKCFEEGSGLRCVAIALVPWSS